MKENKKFKSGQIMVIVLLIISIISIIAVSATLNTTRDTAEQVQDKQYQQYYSVGERNIMDMIRHLGREALDTLDNLIPINGLEYECVDISDGVRCTIDAIDNTYYNLSGTQEVLTTVMDIQDFSSIDAAEGITIDISKDQDLVFDLTTMDDWLGPVAKTMTFGWAASDPVSWNLSYDCYDPGNNLYRTDKFVWDNSGGTNYAQASLSGNSSPIGYFGVTSTGNTITITNRMTCSVDNAQFLRLKPVMDGSSVELTQLEFLSSTVPLVRKITTITTTTNTGNTQNPSAVLETTYFLGESPLSLFDYVLRTEGDVIKD